MHKSISISMHQMADAKEMLTHNGREMKVHIQHMYMHMCMCMCM